MIDFDSIAISIHALRGEGDLDELTQMRAIVISIHALRGEGDYALTAAERNEIISIHALRGEGDERQYAESYAMRHFNPRPPWGGRLYKNKQH